MSGEKLCGRLQSVMIPDSDECQNVDQTQGEVQAGRNLRLSLPPIILDNEGVDV